MSSLHYREHGSESCVQGTWVRVLCTKNMGPSPVYKEHRSETVYSTRSMGLSPVYITGNMGLSPVYKEHRSETVHSTRNMGLSPVYSTGNI